MSTTSPSRLSAVLLATAIAPALVCVVGGPAAANSGRCEPGVGVTVVVDYGPLGGGVVVACDPNGEGRPAAQVMDDVGFDVEYVTSQPGFVCRVDGLPGEDTEDCRNTPPADAYWGLFWSDGDPATWTYSSEGAASLDVPDGGSIGWRFQDGGEREEPEEPPTEAAEAPDPSPSHSPAAQPTKPPPTATPTPSQTAPTPTGRGGKPSSSDQDDTSASPGPSDNDASGQAVTKGVDSSGSKPPHAARSRGHQKQHKSQRPEAEASPDSTIATLEPVSNDAVESDASSPVLTLAAGGAVLLLAGAAGLIAWRRRA